MTPKDFTPLKKKNTCVLYFLTKWRIKLQQYKVNKWKSGYGGKIYTKGTKTRKYFQFPPKKVLSRKRKSGTAAMAFYISLHFSLSTTYKHVPGVVKGP